MSFMVVRISPTIDYEYRGRDVFREAWVEGQHGGIVRLPIDVIREMLADADFYTDPHGPSETPASIRRAYAALRDQIRAALDKDGGV